jgi:hypothetical protein
VTTQLLSGLRRVGPSPPANGLPPGSETLAKRRFNGDSNNGRLLMDIPVQVTTGYNTGLLWSNNDLFVISNIKIKQIDASTGLTIWGWPIPNGSNASCIQVAIPRHGKFISYSANRTVTFRDTSTHAQCGLVHPPQDIYPIALFTGWPFSCNWRRQNHHQTSISHHRMDCLAPLCLQNFLSPIQLSSHAF